MSQEKVDRYKKEKANRKKNMKKEKAMNILRNCVLAAVAVALAGWAGYSAYGKYEANKPQEEAEIDYTALYNLSSNLSSLNEAE